MDRFYNWVGALVARIESEKGQTFVEYALVLSVIVVALLAAMTLTSLETALGDALDSVADAFTP
jgi:Flp pilus assembly pilin Flp